MAQVIRRGILTSFNASTYTASVLIMEATSTQLTGVPIATHMDGTSAQVGALCAVLFFDEQNPNDAVVLALYANGTSGVPTPPPGRVTFVTPTQQISNTTINAGTTQTFTLSGLPSGALGVLFKAYFTAATVPAHIDLAAHGGNLSQTCSVGDLQTANGTLNGMGMLPLDSQGRIDIKANGANCTLNLFTYGYII
ncbi:MAG: hypothetical protein JO202_00360 [Ktedonobacteraceae bacterium]|nr:hypothetical protein [Ktedonobacteraceae bacterium]